jgi:hypothetical protein
MQPFFGKRRPIRGQVLFFHQRIINAYRQLTRQMIVTGRACRSATGVRVAKGLSCRQEMPIIISINRATSLPARR